MGLVSGILRKEVPGTFPRTEPDLPTGWQRISFCMMQHLCRGSAVLLVLGLVTRSLSGKVDSKIEPFEDSLLLPAGPGAVFPLQTHRLTGFLSGKLWRRPRPGKGRQNPQPRTIDCALGERHFLSLYLCPALGRKWLNASFLCLLAHLDRDGAMLVINKDSALRL